LVSNHQTTGRNNPENNNLPKPKKESDNSRKQLVRSVILFFNEDEMGGTCSTHETGRNASDTFVGNPEGKTPLGRPRRRWEDNIRKDLKEIG
jgi:hypothetical protein